MSNISRPHGVSPPGVSQRITAPAGAASADIAARVAAFDWSKTGLGPRSDWPQSLKTAVDIILRSPVPMVLLWGRSGIMIYNAGYAAIAGTRHPQLLGQKAAEAWPEAAD